MRLHGVGISLPRRAQVFRVGRRVLRVRLRRCLFACPDAPRFTAESIVPAIERVHRLSPVERWLYRAVLVPRTRHGLLKQKAQLAWMDSAPDWGPGRSDPFNPAKVQLLGLP